MSEPNFEPIKNCPQCGGILDDFGRCEFCGSKVYDFLCIDFGRNDSFLRSAKTYVRIKVGDNEVLAPVVVDTCNLTMDIESYSILDCTFLVVGDLVMRTATGGEEK